jgi:hypothetical protein
MAGSGTREDPWQLTTANGGSQYQMWRDEAADPPALVCQVGCTQLKYQLRAIDDLAACSRSRATGCRSARGRAEARPRRNGGAWGRSDSNPVGGWYGTKKGLRGRFGVYLPPLLETLGLAELEHNPKNNRMRAR